MLPVLRAPAPAGPVRRPLLKVAAALFRQVVAAVVYGYLGMAWAHSICGVAVAILGRWTCGQGSAAEAIGAAIRAACGDLWAGFFSVNPSWNLEDEGIAREGSNGNAKFRLDPDLL